MKANCSMIDVLLKINDGVFAVDNNFTFTYVNAAFCDAVGFKAKDLLGKNLWSALPKIVGTIAYKQMIEAMENREVRVFEWRGVYTPKRDWETTIYPTSNGLTAITKDITHRKKAAEALKASEARYRSLFENSLDAILLTIPNGVVLSANPASERMFGMTEAEIKRIGRAGLVIFDERAAKAVAEREATGHGRAELTLRRKDGSLFEADVTSNLFTDADGTIKTSMIIRDVTERKKVEEALKVQTQQLENSQKRIEEYASQMEQLATQRAKQLHEQERMVTIGQTAGMVGHDIRNPLQAIVSELYLEKESVSGLPDSEAKNDALESITFIQEQVDYINKIVADLQDYARQTKPNFSQVDLSKLISDTFAAIGIPSNILPTFYVESGLTLRTDPDYLRRIITNLVNNAIQAMSSGGKLKIDACKSNGRIEISIEDTGHGIPEDVKDKLFKPLFTTKSKGQGFGLAVVKKFVEQLGGTLKFESHEGKGTTFRIELPISG